MQQHYLFITICIYYTLILYLVEDDDLMFLPEEGSLAENQSVDIDDPNDEVEDVNFHNDEIAVEDSDMEQEEQRE